MLLAAGRRLVHAGGVELEYLIFDFSDEESGSGSFDAMASVLPERVPALMAEVEAVLRWAHHAFGAPAASDGDGSWDFALHGTAEADKPWTIGYDAQRAQVSFAQPAGGRTTLTLTLSGSAAFCEAFREAFSV